MNEHRIRVLLVDDDEVDGMMVRRAFEDDPEFELRHCPNADAALHIAAQGEVDALLSDLHMPGHDGAWLVEQVRARGFDVAMLVLTGRGDQQSAVELMKAGAQDYLRKDDLDPARLKAALRSAVQVRAAERRSTQISEALRRSEERLRLALEVAELGIFDVDLASHRIEVDDRARALLGATADRPIDEAALRDGIYVEDRDRVLSELTVSLAPGSTTTFASTHRMIGIDDGVLRWLHIVARATRREGRVVRVVGTVADVTERQRQTELDRARLESEQQLIGIVSHDLRNPISSMVMSASLLAHRLPADGPDARVAVRILESGQRASRLIHDLLDFTRARSSVGIPLLLREADLHEICCTAVEEIAVSWSSRRIVRTTNGEGGGTWDADRLVQLVGNLVANALVHGDPLGTVTVSSSVRGEHARIEVHNDGPPIADATRERLFEPFTRHESGSDRGVGLGLFIVREIARAHGGDVHVHSHPGDGTTFTVELPRTKPGD